MTHKHWTIYLMTAAVVAVFVGIFVSPRAFVATTICGGYGLYHLSMWLRGESSKSLSEEVHGTYQKFYGKDE